jgi:integrase/recombinase XerD
MKNYLQQHYSPSTARAYEREIANYLSNYPGAATALYKDITAYIGWLRKRYTNPHTLNRILCGVKAYYAYLCDAGIRSDNPAKAVRLRDRRSGDIQLQDLFTAEELEKLLNAAERYSELESRNKTLMSLLIYQGLTPQEAAAVETKDIDWRQATLTVSATAAGRRRVLPLKATQILLLTQYTSTERKKLLGEKSTEKLIVSYRGEAMSAGDIAKHVLRRYGGCYSPRKVTALTIRQSVITNLFGQGNDLSLVQAFAGHKHPSTTEKYRQSNVATLQAAVNKYHPLQ